MEQELSNSENKLNNLINSEKVFFSAINKSLRDVSETDLIRWRNETVQARRNRISIELYQRVNGTVRYGPFEGMKLSKKLGGVGLIWVANV